MTPLRCVFLIMCLLSARPAAGGGEQFMAPLSLQPQFADTTRPFGPNSRSADLLGLPTRGPWDASMRGGQDPNLVSSARTPVADQALVGAYGNVVDIARAGSTLYLAGSFRKVGENVGGFVSVDAGTGALRRPFPKVAGTVYSMVPDSDGGWYLGGEFSAVGGEPRRCLAHVRVDGSVSDWAPDVGGSQGLFDTPSVRALALVGDRMFIGGNFLEIGGWAHRSLGCVDLHTGAPLPWNLDINTYSGYVLALRAHENSVFVGGSFDSLGGQPRSDLAAIDATTGTVLAWRADVIEGVSSLLSRGNTLYVAGDFEGIAGQLRTAIAAVDIPTAQLLPFNARATGVRIQNVTRPYIQGLALIGDTLLVGGSFLEIGGRAGKSLAALDAVTGDALDWTPPSFGPQYDGFNSQSVDRIIVAGSRIYAAGTFETVNGLSQPRMVELDRATGAVLPWNPAPDLPVEAMALRDNTLFLGGSFGFMGNWRHRAGLAAIDLTTGALKPWNPNPNGSICTAIQVYGDQVFVSGDFSTIGGDPQPRMRLAALDTLNGEVLDWDPGANGTASSLLFRGDTLFAGGSFTQVGGQPRRYLASIDANTGGVTDWDPDADSWVQDLGRIDNTIIAGGLFTKVGGQWRRYLAAVDATTGGLTPWDPEADNVVESLFIAGDKVYVGGGFTTVGGQPRRSLAALDAVTGEATPWDPNPAKWYLPSPRIRAMALQDSVLWVGGNFAAIGGRPRICFAGVDTATGLATDWDPGGNDVVWSLASHGNTVYVGGGFTRMGGLPAAGLAAFTTPGPSPPPPPAVPPTFALSQSMPNPARTATLIRYSLARPGPVRLTVHDLHGRRVSALVDVALQGAGSHEVSASVGNWPPGVYLYRLEADGQSSTRKLVVVD